MEIFKLSNLTIAMLCAGSQYRHFFTHYKTSALGKTDSTIILPRAMGKTLFVDLVN